MKTTQKEKKNPIDHYLTNLDTNILKKALDGVAQLVGASSGRPKDLNPGPGTYTGCGFDP